MKVADLHVDVLYKLLERPGSRWSGAEPMFDVTPERLGAGGVGLQVFALYLPDTVPAEPESILRSVAHYWSEILTKAGVAPVRGAEELKAAWDAPDRMGALLSLEGADGLQGKLWLLPLLHRLGLRLLGPTWNHANWACDGALEPRGGGLTRAGKRLVAECESLGILLDVSHLSERGFYDLAATASRPFLASHSNCRALRDHPRNLTDEQIRTLLAANGLLGLTFVPAFVAASDPVTIDDLLRHVERVCELGGAERLAFGSDFDGIERHIVGLEHPGRYPALAEALLRFYPEPVVKGFMGENAYCFLAKNLAP